MIKQQIKEYVQGLKKIDHTFITSADYLIHEDNLPELVGLGIFYHVLAIKEGVCYLYDRQDEVFTDTNIDDLTLEEILDIGEAYEKLVMT